MFREAAVNNLISGFSSAGQFLSDQKLLACWSFQSSLACRTTEAAFCSSSSSSLFWKLEIKLGGRRR